MTVDGICYFIAQKKALILLERMKFARETTKKKKKREMKEDVLHAANSTQRQKKMKEYPQPFGSSNIKYINLLL